MRTTVPAVGLLLCSQLKVLNATALNFLKTPSFNLTVQAYLSGSSSTFTNAQVTVILTPVLTAPVVLQQSMSVPQLSPDGTPLGKLNYTSRLPMNVSWSIGVDTSGGLFSVDPVSGVVSVAVNGSAGLNYFGSVNLFTLGITATSTIQVRIASLFEHTV